jgi:hypothetical protein
MNIQVTRTFSTFEMCWWKIGNYKQKNVIWAMKTHLGLLLMRQ